MVSHQQDKISYLTFNIFAESLINHAVFMRRGGISSPPWAQLNVGSTVGDNQDSVNENLRRSFEAVGRKENSMFDSWLVHGTQVLIADHPAPPSIERPRKADIILTDKLEVTLFMRYADCVPILLHDPNRGVVGLVHAGWKGTVKRVVEVAVDAIVSKYGSVPQDIQAAIGPSIGPHHYEVGQEVIAKVQATFGRDAPEFLPEYNESTHFDLWAANKAILNQAGVHQIDHPEHCTACQVDDWFSHRAEHGRTGRFGVLIGLNPN